MEEAGPSRNLIASRVNRLSPGQPAISGHDAPQGVDVRPIQIFAMRRQVRPGIPHRADQATGDAVTLGDHRQRVADVGELLVADAGSVGEMGRLDLDPGPAGPVNAELLAAGEDRRQIGRATCRESV